MTGGEKYLKGKSIPEELISVQRDGFIESYILSFLLNDYHQAKSKEEAEDFRILRNPPEGFRIDYMPSEFLPKTRGVLMLHPDLIPKPPAAFGKEGEG